MKDDALVQQQKTLFIIWLALLSSLGVYGLIGSMVLQPSEDAVVPPMLAEVLIGVVVSEMVVIFAVLPKLLKPKNLQAATTFFIVRWALAESIGIYGLVLHILGGSALHLWGFLGAGAFCMLMLHPSVDAIRQSVGSEPTGH